MTRVSLDEIKQEDVVFDENPYPIWINDDDMTWMYDDTTDGRLITPRMRLCDSRLSAHILDKKTFMNQSIMNRSSAKYEKGMYVGYDATIDNALGFTHSVFLNDGDLDDVYIDLIDSSILHAIAEMNFRINTITTNVVPGRYGFNVIREHVDEKTGKVITALSDPVFVPWYSLLTSRQYASKEVLYDMKGEEE